MSMVSFVALAANDATNIVAVVTAQRQGERYFFVKDEATGEGWRVSPDGRPYCHYEPGERVAIHAELEPKPNRHTRRLFSADVTRLGAEGEERRPVARKVRIGELYRRTEGRALPDPDWYGDYITVEGKLIDCNRRDTMTSFLLWDEGDHLQFSVPMPIADPLPEYLEKGAIVRVTGAAVYTAVRRDGKVVDYENVGIIPDGIECVEVTSRPPFWTKAKVLVLVGALIGIILLGVCWVYLLRRTVARMEASIRQKVRDKVAAEATRRERLRLSHDLHDDFQQLLASSTFRLAAAQNNLQNGASREDVLKMLGRVEDSIAHAQAGLRAALWSMSEEAEGPSRMSELFTYAAGRLAQWKDVVSFTFTGVETPLSSRFAGALLMILQEAVGNALRHGGADNVRVKVDFAPACLTMTITDDGSGFEFDASMMSAAASGTHLGLAGMRARCVNLGGEFAVESEIGRGTTLTIKVPVGGGGGVVQ